VGVKGVVRLCLRRCSGTVVVVGGGVGIISVVSEHLVQCIITIITGTVIIGHFVAGCCRGARKV
jgi:hypothetical protein